MSIPLVIAGAAGRMGRRLVALASEDPSFQLKGGLDAPGGPLLGRDLGLLAGVGELGLELTDDPSCCRDALVVEFTVAGAAGSVFNAAMKAGARALVSGTTALQEADEAALAALAERAAVLNAPNFSIGVAVLSALVEQAVRAMGEGTDVEILELHHRKKVDAPSGTAAALASRVQRGRQRALKLRHGRSGHVGQRGADELGLMALRGGDVVGEHSVFLFGEGERLELTHRAATRDIFVRGALRVGTWLVRQPPGRYLLEDALGL